MTTVLCPVSYTELRVGWSQALVWCPRCNTHHARGFLADRDDTPCRCGHRRTGHGPRWGLTYACPSAGCGCTDKEKPMADTKPLPPADAAWVERQRTPHWDPTGHARQMRAEGRRVCPHCDHWHPVTKAGAYRVHRRTDPQQWLTVPCEGSRQPAAD